jgi:hypothetical protein
MIGYIDMAVATPTALTEGLFTWLSGSVEQLMLLRRDSGSDTVNAIHEVPGYTVLEPIPFQAERICAECVLTDEVFDRYGTGDTFSEALKDLAGAISDYYTTLRAEKDSLSHGAKEHLKMLQTYLSA